MRNSWLAFLAVAVAFGQAGTRPKGSPEEYPVHAQDGTTGIGAEFMVHSFSGGEEMYLAKDYLVVEVALFPAKGQAIEVNAAAFWLVVNGRKPGLGAQAPSAVAASLARPEWHNGPHVEMAGGLGNAQVVLGRPPHSSIPGNRDPTAPGPDGPPAPKDDPNGGEARPRPTPAALVVETALPPGPRKGPVSGFLYFAFTGKTSSIKSLELIYNSTVLRLR